MNLAQIARNAEFAKIAALPPDVQAEILSDPTYRNGFVLLDLPYWSTVRLLAARAGSGPFTYTIDTSIRKAFAYAVGQPMTQAGFASGNATTAETNLLQQSATRDNADVFIWGLAAHLTPDSEASLAARVWREADVSISLNGTQQIPIGTLEMFPSAGGLMGAGRSFIKAPDLATPGAVDNGQGATLSILSNGNPMAGNFYRFNQPFKWTALGSKGSDSALVVSVQPQRQIVESSMAARAGTTGVSAYTPPAATGDLGTYVDIRFHLVCISIQAKSKNT